MTISKTFDVNVVQKRTFSFTVEAKDEEEAMLKAYDAYCNEIDDGDVDNFLVDEDLEYEDVYEHENKG